MDFHFLQDPISHKWISLSPRRAHRTNSDEGAKGEGETPIVTQCPFCPGIEASDGAVYAMGVHKQIATDSVDWLTRVLPNKFPFAPIHEVIIHSPDHHKSFGELPLSHVARILQTYKQRYNAHKEKGHVYIFHNNGEKAGESLPHPHSQLAVIPHEVAMDISPYQISDYQFMDTGLFRLGCPDASQWPDEVWFIPKITGHQFGEISLDEIMSLSDAITRVIKIYDHRYGHEFPFNFFIKPGIDWYLRLIPRVKTLGGFEVGSGVFVNTQDPKETIAFLHEHFHNPDFEKIKQHHKAGYREQV